MKLHVAALASIVLLALVVSAPPSAPPSAPHVINITEVGTGNVSQLVKLTRCDVVIPLPQEPDKYSLLRGVVVCVVSGKRWQTTVDTIPLEWVNIAPAVEHNLTDAEWLLRFGEYFCTQNQTRYVRNNTTFIEECDWMDNAMPSGRGALGLVKRTWRINETDWASLYSGAWPKDGVTEKRWQ